MGVRFSLPAQHMNGYFTPWQIFWEAVIVITYVMLLILVRHYRPRWLHFGTKPYRHDLLVTFGILAAFAIIGAGCFWDDLISFAPRFNPLVSSLVVVYIFAIVAPAEEIVFRGFIQGHLAKKLGDWPAILTTSALFGLMHLPNGATGTAIDLWNWKLAVLAAIAGIGFGWVYSHTKSLWNPILLHAIVSSAYFLFIH